MKFRAKLAKMGDRYVIIIPAKYRKDAKPFKGRDVDVEMLAV